MFFLLIFSFFCLGEDLVVEGSLGGIQIVDLTPEGMKHQRILSLGADPLGNETIADLSAGLYSLSHYNSDKTAFSFSVKRSLQSGAQGIFSYEKFFTNDYL